MSDYSVPIKVKILFLLRHGSFILKPRASNHVRFNKIQSRKPKAFRSLDTRIHNRDCLTAKAKKQ